MTHYKCVIHGSFRKHFDLIQDAYTVFTNAGIEVIAPEQSSIVAFDDSFALLEGQEGMD